jgi:hypothetical protein
MRDDARQRRVAAREHLRGADDVAEEVDTGRAHAKQPLECELEVRGNDVAADGLREACVGAHAEGVQGAAFGDGREARREAGDAARSGDARLVHVIEQHAVHAHDDG